MTWFFEHQPWDALFLVFWEDKKQRVRFDTKLFFRKKKEISGGTFWVSKQHTHNKYGKNETKNKQNSAHTHTTSSFWQFPIVFIQILATR